MRDVAPPVMEELARYAAPLKQFLSPVALGLDDVRKQGAVLLVGNHTVYGMLDMPLFTLEFYEKTGRMVRALGDHFHFDVPLWRIGEMSWIFARSDNLEFC